MFCDVLTIPLISKMSTRGLGRRWPIYSVDIVHKGSVRISGGSEPGRKGLDHTIQHTT